MTPHYADDLVTLYDGDCLDVLRELPDASVDAVVTDPPYGLNFMGKDWDKIGEADLRAAGMLGHQSQNWSEKATHSRGYADNDNLAFQAWCELWARECLRVLKPGGHLLSFGGSRTYHRMACAVEDAGFEVRDCLMWLYGSGFPKSLDVSKAIDKAAGAEGSFGGPKSAAHAGWIERGVMRGADGHEGYQRPWMADTEAVDRNAREYLPGTPQARAYKGWGTALKPAHEPIILARKPLIGTVAANVLAHGTGALNVDGCRVGDEVRSAAFTSLAPAHGNRLGAPGTAEARRGTQGEPKEYVGRWPANVILDPAAAAILDEQSGERPGFSTQRDLAVKEKDLGSFLAGIGVTAPGVRQGFNDTGGASRFFYTAKAGSDERPKVDGIAHPTVKPLDLMRWLVRLVTPPGGTVLEPFAGSGTTLEACVIEGFTCIGIEREADYLRLIEARLTKPIQPDMFGGVA